MIGFPDGHVRCGSTITGLVTDFVFLQFIRFGTLRSVWVARKPPGFGMHTFPDATMSARCICFGPVWRERRAGCDSWVCLQHSSNLRTREMQRMPFARWMEVSPSLGFLQLLT